MPRVHFHAAAHTHGRRGKTAGIAAQRSLCFSWETVVYGDWTSRVRVDVVFSSSGSPATLTARLERTLSAGFGYEATVAVRSGRQFRAIVDAAPEGFGVDRERYRSDVIFLMPPLTPARAIADVPTREGVDRAWTGPGVLYFERLGARAAQSRLSKIVSLPIYRSLTIRNWATTCTLLEMLETAQR